MNTCDSTSMSTPWAHHKNLAARLPAWTHLNSCSPSFGLIRHSWWTVAWAVEVITWWWSLLVSDAQGAGTLSTNSKSSGVYWSRAGLGTWSSSIRTQQLADCLMFTQRSGSLPFRCCSSSRRVTGIQRSQGCKYYGSIARTSCGSGQKSDNIGSQNAGSRMSAALQCTHHHNVIQHVITRNAEARPPYYISN